MYDQYHYDTTDIFERTPLRLHLQDTQFMLHHFLIRLKVPAEPPAKHLQVHVQLPLFTIWAQELQILQLERPQEFRAFKQKKVLCYPITEEAPKI